MNQGGIGWDLSCWGYDCLG